ncbi:hypothetical protein O0L34_g14434 [Tuta absoluta]|nr:hypothetical protein O0L34_g14434 [Tuta absoluta]
MAKYVKIGKSIRDNNRSLRKSPTRSPKTNIYLKPERSMQKTKSFIIEENWRSQDTLAIGQPYRAETSWNKVIPVQLDVLSQRPHNEPDPHPEEYAVACLVPYDHSNKANLHKIDTSCCPITDRTRPVYLEVVVPVAQTSKKTVTEEAPAETRFIEQHKELFPTNIGF